MISPNIQPNKKNLKDMMLSLGVTIGFCIMPLVFGMWCWNVTKFPPQLFGDNEDHFRAHVINPIPESVTILNVEFSDLIIHPDVSYFFRFSVNRNDLEKILLNRKLKPIDECSDNFSLPDWWDISSSDDIEAYEYNSPGGTIISLCYRVPSQIAYYIFWTY
jgi:hypothetical protein